MANTIEIYQGNSRTVACTVSGLTDLSGYTATLTVKKAAKDAAADIVLQKTGTINLLVITFVLSGDDNTLPSKQYVYDITITDGTNIYTVVQDKYIILESVKF